MAKKTRKSKRQQLEEKRKQRMRFWMAMIAIGLMVVSMFAFVVVFYSTDAQTGYDFDYEVRDNTLLVRTDQGAIPFYNFPDERYTLTAQQAQIIQNAQTLVLATNASDNQTFELTEFVRFDISQYTNVQGAQTTGSTDSSLPVVSCQDATVDAPVVILDANSTGLSTSQNCFVFGARGQDAVFVRDALLYAYFDLL